MDHFFPHTFANGEKVWAAQGPRLMSSVYIHNTTGKKYMFDGFQWYIVLDSCEDVDTMLPVYSTMICQGEPTDVLEFSLYAGFSLSTEFSFNKSSYCNYMVDGADSCMGFIHESDTVDQTTGEDLFAIFHEAAERVLDETELPRQKLQNRVVLFSKL